MPVVIEDTFTGIAQDLFHPRIGWHQEPGTIAATNAADGFPASNALTPVTYTAWQPSAAPASLRITFTAAASPSYLGIAVHTIADAGATVTVRKLTGGAWSNWGGGTSITPETNDPILFLLEPQEVDGIGIQVTGGTPVIGVMRAGTVMEWPRKATWTGLPITESARYQYDVNTSDTGSWLGRSLKSNGREFDVQIDHLSETYRRGDFRDFANHANTGDATFFIGPRPLNGVRRNLLDWSEAFDNAVWAKFAGATVTANAIAAPDGTLTADLVQGGSSASSSVSQTTSAQPSTTYYPIGYIKNDDALNSRFLVRSEVGGANVESAYIDIAWSAGVPTLTPTSALSSVSKLDQGDGWWRISCAYETTSDAESIKWEVQPDRNAGTAGISLWGAQVEEGTLTAYQKTEDGTEFFSDEVAYAWSPDAVRMTREQPNKRISGSVSLSLQGYLAP